MKKIFIFIFSILLLFSVVKAQNHIESYVIGFGAVYSENNNNNFQATLGESFIGTSQNENLNSIFGFWANFHNLNNQLILLIPSWNMISSNLTPLDPSLTSIYSPLGSNFLLAKDNIGNVYWPEWGINDIGNWDYTQGYQVFVLNSDTLVIIGNYINPSTNPINLLQGWNMFAYLRNSIMSPAEALTSIQGNFLLMKDNIGNVYWPEWGIDDIGNMQPGQGYQIYMSQDWTLIYPGN